MAEKKTTKKKVEKKTEVSRSVKKGHSVKKPDTKTTKVVEKKSSPSKKTNSSSTVSHSSKSVKKKAIHHGHDEHHGNFHTHPGNHREHHKRQKIVESPYDELYVQILEAKEKRADLLTGIKTALMMQEESERIASIRRKKTHTLNEIRADMLKMNNQYQKLKSLLPNVKNVISMTEQELIELDSQIEMLKSDIKADEENIELDMSLQDSIYSGGDLRELDAKLYPKQTNDGEKVRKLEPVGKMISIKESEGVSKLDRIKNNLKVIESKLKRI